MEFYFLGILTGAILLGIGAFVGWTVRGEHERRFSPPLQSLWDKMPSRSETLPKEITTDHLKSVLGDFIQVNPVEAALKENEGNELPLGDVISDYE